jgi:hypothetical protein
MRFAKLIPTAAGLAAITIGPAAHAADTANVGLGEVQDRMNKAASTHATENMLRLLSPGEVLRVLIVARQSATASSCDGYEVDEEKFRTVMNDIVAKLAELTEEGQNNLPIDSVMAGYYTVLGGQLAIAAYDLDAYCAAAAEVREALKDDADGRLSIWKTAD